MSQQMSEAPQEAGGHASTPQDAASEAETDAVITKISGEKWGIKLSIITPVQSQQGATAQEMNLSFQFHGSLRLQDDDSVEAQRRKWFKEMRGWLMVLATVAASVTYQAGLNPPGGFWQDDPTDKSHRAGDPALHDEHHSRYMTFYYFNATAFVTSLVIMVQLMSERFYHTESKVLALLLATIVDLASLIGAYIAGTTRYFSSCIYIIVITCVAFVAVIYIGEGMTEICFFVMITLPCMETLAENKWCPIPAGVVKKAKMMKAERQRRHEDRRRRNDPSRSNTGACCLCCA